MTCEMCMDGRHVRCTQKSGCGCQLCDSDLIKRLKRQGIIVTGGKQPRNPPPPPKAQAKPPRPPQRISTGGKRGVKPLTEEQKDEICQAALELVRRVLESSSPQNTREQ